MRMQQKMGEQEMSPHLRQRIAFIAALIPDSTGTHWSAISDIWDDLSRETEGSAFKEQVQSLHEPILRRDADGLVRAIGALLKAA